ncbi:MAG TPA: DNA-binding domain-containing protein [Polyangiaceae bacterium]|jgi:hypothetical protein
MKLGELQAMFAEALPKPQSFATSCDWVARGKETFGGSERLAPIEQLDVYREQFWIRHLNCLAEDFPVLHALVGDAKFEALVAEYLAAHPPTHFQLRHLGAKLAEFLRGHDDDALLSDLARLEWAYVDAFDAADAPPLDPNAVAAIPEDAWASARLRLHPSLQLLRLVYPTHEMRAKWWADKDVRPIERVERAAATVVVYRHKFLLYTEVMEPLAFEMLERFGRGETLGAAGDALGAEVEEKIGEWFARWAGLGWISSVEV